MVILGFVFSVSGCASGELDVSCGEFLDRSPEEQDQLAQTYTEKLAEEGEGSIFSDEASENIESLRDHCANNKSDKLSELQPII